MQRAGGRLEVAHLIATARPADGGGVQYARGRRRSTDLIVERLDRFAKPRDRSFLGGDEPAVLGARPAPRRLNIAQHEVLEVAIRKHFAEDQLLAIGQQIKSQGTLAARWPRTSLSAMAGYASAILCVSASSSRSRRICP
jgi:hypothetical protein